MRMAGIRKITHVNVDAKMFKGLLKDDWEWWMQIIINTCTWILMAILFVISHQLRNEYVKCEIHMDYCAIAGNKVCILYDMDEHWKYSVTQNATV